MARHPDQQPSVPLSDTEISKFQAIARRLAGENIGKLEPPTDGWDTGDRTPTSKSIFPQGHIAYQGDFPMGSDEIPPSAYRKPGQ